jgi:RND family efflux transporter MFP subunit
MRKFLILLVSLSIAVFLGCKKETQRALQEEVFPVEVTPVKRMSLERWEEAVGNVSPYQGIRITPKVPGKIEAIYVKEGDQVKEGQALVKLDQTDFLLALEKAEASYKSAQAQLEQARLKLQDAERDYQRAKVLFEEKVISQKEYEKIEINFKAAQAQYELAQAQLKAASSALKQAQTELKDTIIYAPFSGYVSAKFVDPGQRAYTMPPTDILELVDISKVKILLDLPERDLPFLKLGSKVEARSDAFPNLKLEGKVSRIYPKIDPSTRSFRIEVLMDNPKGILKPGMFVTARVFLGKEEALVIPRDALLRAPGTGIEYCFVVINERAQRRELTTGIRQENLVEIKQGLKEGELVVSSGAQNLRPGVRVNIKRTVSL